MTQLNKVTALPQIPWMILQEAEEQGHIKKMGGRRKGNGERRTEKTCSVGVESMDRNNEKSAL